MTPERRSLLATGNATVLCLGMFVTLASATVSPAPPSSRTESDPGPAMREHYDAAYRLQSQGQIPEADREHTLFLAAALHRIANGRANIGAYEPAKPLYEEAHRLAPEDTGLELDYAKAAMDAEDPTRARVLLQELLDRHPPMTGAENSTAHRLFAESLQATGDHEKALAIFKEIAAQYPNFENLYGLGKDYFSRGDKESGAKVFSSMLPSFGDTAVMHMDFGLAYARANYLPEAIEEFKKAIAKDDRLPGLHYSLGAAYMSLPGNEVSYSEAETEFRKEIALQPDDPLSYPQLGRIALNRHDDREAEIDLNRAVALNPNNSDTYLLLSQLYTETENRPAAEMALRKAIASTLDPSQNHYEIHSSHYQLGRLLIQDGKVAEGRQEMKIAEQLLSESRQQDENSLTGKAAVQQPLQQTRIASPAEIAEEKAFEDGAAPLIAGSYNNLGVHAAMEKNYAVAANDFEHASEWNSGLKGLDSNWSYAAYAAHQYAQAVAPLQRLLTSHPEDNQTRSMLAICEYKVRDYGSVLQTLQPIEPGLGRVQFLALAYAESMAKAGDSAQGMDRLKQLVQENPGFPAAHRALGEAYQSSGDLEQAAAELRTAVQLNAGDADAQYSLAVVLAATGHAPEAEASLARLAADASQDSRVFYQLGKLQLGRGDLKAAIGTLETAVKMSPADSAIHLTLADAYHRNAQLPDAERETSLGQELLAKQAPQNTPASVSTASQPGGPPPP